MSRIILVLITAFLLVGCSLKEVSKPITIYTLHVEIKNSNEQNKSGKILKISNIKSAKFTNSSQIWYKIDDNKIGSYVYSQWNESFTDLLEQNLVESIYKKSIFKSVFMKYSKIKPDFVLESEIYKSIQNVKSTSTNVEFGIRLYLIDQKRSTLISTKDFSYVQKSDNADAKGAVNAYNKIIKKLNKDVTSWLKKLAIEN